MCCEIAYDDAATRHLKFRIAGQPSRANLHAASSKNVRYFSLAMLLDQVESKPLLHSDKITSDTADLDYRYQGDACVKPGLDIEDRVLDPKCITMVANQIYCEWLCVGASNIRFLRHQLTSTDPFIADGRDQFKHNVVNLLSTLRRATCQRARATLAQALVLSHRPPYPATLSVVDPVPSS